MVVMMMMMMVMVVVAVVVATMKSHDPLIRTGPKLAQPILVVARTWGFFDDGIEAVAVGTVDTAGAATEAILAVGLVVYPVKVRHAHAERQRRWGRDDMGTLGFALVDREAS